jgi:hypothetical protein
VLFLADELAVARSSLERGEPRRVVEPGPAAPGELAPAAGGRDGSRGAEHAAQHERPDASFAGLAVHLRTILGRLGQDARRIRLAAWAFAGLLAVAFFGLVTPLKSIDTVENGHIGILKQFGSLVGTTGEGFVTHAPWSRSRRCPCRTRSARTG